MQVPTTAISQQIWRSLKTGSQQALEKLYLEYAGKLYNYGSKFTRDRELVKDCIQELFITLWDRRQHLGEPANIGNYLYKAFRSAIFKKTAALNRRESFTQAEHYPFYAVLSIQDHLIEDEKNKDIRVRLQTAMTKLTGRQQEAIYLKFYENLSYDEIAGIMDISTKGTYKLMARALDVLRSGLEKEDIWLLFTLLYLKLFH